MKKTLRVATRLAIYCAVVVAILAAMFVANGLLLDQNKPVEFRIESNKPAAEAPDTIRVLTFNVHRCNAIVEGGAFGVTVNGPAAVNDAAQKIAAFLREQDADIVILNEVCLESVRSRLNQVEFLAREAGYPYAVFGYETNFGLPFLRHRQGNAILSKFPILDCANLDIVPPLSPLTPGASRRLLKATVNIGGTRVAVLAIHLDVGNAERNLAEATALRKAVESIDAPVVLAGDFNATPESASMLEIRGTGSLRGPEAFSPTYVAYPPRRTLDYVFGPAAWEFVSEEALVNDLSDHYAVMAIFRRK